MSRVKDLEIRGVRNFGDESAKARIHFSRPLTLILGPNGTGKTTIIEALKYMSSGEYPPDSDRGKSFVHEPKLTSSHTVRGQVKGKIVDKRGQELVVSRTMQVSRQKNNALKFQALDNTITRYDQKTKQKIQLSSRCADIDREMLDAMGVSKAILNYVIFCHQEESNWPLEDGKKLKDRFDEIFDTSKYNKAMDVTTKLIKEMQSELKVTQATENGLKAIVEVVKSEEDKLKNKVDEEQRSQDRMKKIKESLLPIDEKMEEIMATKEKHTKIDDKLKSVESDYKLTNNHIVSLKKHIKNLHQGTKEELMEKIASFDTNYTQKSKLKIKNEDKLRMIQKEEKILSNNLANARIKRGSFQQKKIAFDEKVSKRNELLNKSLRTWDIPQNDSELTEKEITEHINYVETKFDQFDMDRKSKIQDNEQEEGHVQGVVDSSRSVKTGIDSELSLKQKEKEDTKREINELRIKIKQTGEAGSKLQNIESKLQTASQQYENLVKDFNEVEMKENLQKATAEKKRYEARIDCLDKEINSLHEQSAQQAELELQQDDLKSKETYIESMMSKHKNNLETLFSGKEIPQRKLKYQLDSIYTALTKEKNDATKEIDEKQKKLTAIETGLKYNEKEYEKKRHDLEELKEKVYIQCKEIEYEEVLMLQEKKVKHLQDKRGIYANQKLLYEEFLKKMKKKSCCPLCERGFAEGNDEKQLEQRLLAEIKKSPQSLKECEAELKKEQAQYDALQQLKPITEQLKEMETIKIPKLKSLIARDKSEFQKAEEALEEMRLALIEPEQQLTIYKTINSDVTLLDNALNEKENLISSINNKKKEMSKAGKIGNRGMKEAQNERNALRKKISSLETRIEQLQSDLQVNQEKIQKAREHKNKLKEEVIKIQEGMQALNQLRAKVNDLYEKEKSLDVDVRALRQRLVQAEEDLNSKQEELTTLKKKNGEEQEKDRNFKSICSNEIHELKSVQREVEVYINNKIEENLLNVETEEKRIMEECEEKKQEREGLEEHIRFLDEQCKSQESGKRDLNNNLELMSYEENLEELNRKISKYKEELDKLKYESCKKEYSALQEKRDSYEKELNTIKGTLSELVKTIKDLKKGLNSEKYRMARHNYKEKRYALTVQQEAIANLKIYVTVLDKAMIQFHEERMNTVNKIMKQLWTLVYGGNDTSSIQIRVQTTEGIGDKKRSYNYKLVQVKRSTEMDMKGKCSAGQKVLASIIIRIALAETFCTDCAVLALDEPTTNLDEENAKNLAETLSKVIQLRAQHHKNFQLIVISHDEKFISTLSNLSGKQMFQELYRNEEGFSLVRRRDMTEYTKNSQTPADIKYEDDSDEEEENGEEQVPQKRAGENVGNSGGRGNERNGSLDVEASQSSSRSSARKRNFDFDDSPPRANKKRAYF